MSSQKLISVQEYADIHGVSRQAVMKRIKSGQISAIQVPHPTVANRVSYMIEVSEQDTPAPDPVPVPDPVHEPINDATLPSFNFPPPSGSEYIPLHKMDEAQAFASFMQYVESSLDSATSKTDAWDQIVKKYNAKSFNLFHYRGPRSERAIRNWLTTWISSGRDMFALLHQNTSSQRGRSVSEFETNYLLAHCLRDSQPSIASVINRMKTEASMGLYESPSSVSTLKRWIQDWIVENPDLWGQARKGSKHVKDTIVKSIQRDSSMIQVGDVLVADGHTLSFDVINPMTGKPARLTLILIYDWASRFPLGAALSLTESSAHVLTAVRNAILHLGFLPKFIYFDNGKAFKSALFHGKWESHDLNSEFAGIFPRLGIQAEFAEAYNARSKNIERFFRTMQEQFERFQTTFRGRNIDDKPASHSRNEKWAKKMFAGAPLEYAEALSLVYYYFRYEYGMSPHSALKGRKPFEVFEARSIDQSRTFAVEHLNFLMLKAERKKLRSEGLWLNNCRYYHESFVKYVGQPVIIRYDFADLRWILVYDANGHFIAKAPIRESQHAFVYLEKDNPIPHEKLLNEIKANKKALKNIEKATTHTIKHAQRVVDAELSRHREIKDKIMEEIEENNPTFRQPPMIEPPIEPKSAQDAIAKIAAQARQEELLHASPDHIIDTAPPQKESTFSKILKRRGIL